MLLVAATLVAGGVVRTGAGLLRLPPQGLRLATVGWPAGPLDLELVVIEPQGATAWMVVDRTEGKQATAFACRVELRTSYALACHRIPRPRGTAGVHFAYQQGRMLLAYRAGPTAAAQDTHLVLLDGERLVVSAPLGAAATEGLTPALLLGLLPDGEGGPFELWLYGRRDEAQRSGEGGHLREARRIVIGYEGSQAAPRVTPLPDEPADLVPEAVAATSPRTIFCRSNNKLLRLQADRIEPVEGFPPCAPTEACLLPLERLGYQWAPSLFRRTALVEPDGTLTALVDLPGLEHLKDEYVTRHAVVSLAPRPGPRFVRISHLDIPSVRAEAMGGGVLSFPLGSHVFALLLQAQLGSGPAIPILSDPFFAREAFIPWRDGVLMLALDDVEGQAMALDWTLRRTDREAAPRGLLGTMAYWLDRSPVIAWTHVGTLAAYLAMASVAARWLARTRLRAAPSRLLMAALVLFVLLVGTVVIGIYSGFEGALKP